MKPLALELLHETRVSLLIQKGHNHMETPEYIRFRDYVDSNSRIDARPKRLALFSLLSGRTFMSVSAMVEAVGGNTKLQAWVAQAQKDGEIVRDARNVLTIPSARDTAERESTRSPDGVWTSIRDHLRKIADETPDWAKAAERCFEIMGARYADMVRAQKDFEDEPDVPLRTHLRLIDHETCTATGGHCEDENCPGRYT
jgi:hypothetical protein